MIKSSKQSSKRGWLSTPSFAGRGGVLCVCVVEEVGFCGRRKG